MIDRSGLPITTTYVQYSSVAALRLDRNDDVSVGIAFAASHFY